MLDFKGENILRLSWRKKMEKIDLGGSWNFGEAGSDTLWSGHLPGSNYLDLMEAGVIEDPFWGQNEEGAKEIGEKNYEYSRTFTIDLAFLEQDKIDLVISGLDTLATIHLNGMRIGYFENAHRFFRIPVKAILKAGENKILIQFSSPQAYIRAKAQENPMFSMGMAANAPHIRKPQCHFGWDWGPILPPVGIHGHIALEGYSLARLSDLRIEQEHMDGRVLLHLSEKLERFGDLSKPLWMRVSLKSPAGFLQEYTLKVDSETPSLDVTVEKPQLWWCSGLGEQPLYELGVEILADEKSSTPLDQQIRKIGLRTIRLDTAPDRWGKNFCFYINNVPVFAKGANWIPSDSFVTRTTPTDLEFYIRSAKEANMNMLRVWGGGYYESETFYDLCDQYGILVWQDCAFACMEYPLQDQDFLQNVRAEISDQVRRLRHRASLALWCGNNEIKMISRMFKEKKRSVHDQFFYKTLAEWIKEDDRITPYWPSSPCSNEAGTKANSLKEGDTHLWQVWHGMQPLESFRNYPTRFCSEFGVESLPGRLGIQSFTDLENPGLFDPVIQAHQKSVGGNEKMLYYILSKYRHPASLEDFIYLSQLIQSETVRMATEFWRRNSERCHGAIYWQYNDCWPVASWAGIDYLKQFKALQYRAKHFNAMLCVLAEMHKNRADIYVINDLRQDFKGSLCCRLVDFNGKEINKEEFKVSVGKNSSWKLVSIIFKDILGGIPKNQAALILELRDQKGRVVSRQHNLLVADKEAALPKPVFTTEVAQHGETGSIFVTSAAYSRFTWVQLEGVHTPLSDNFFDLEAGQKVELTFNMPAGKKAEDIAKGVRIMDLTSVGVQGSLVNDKWLRLKMFLKPANFFSWIVFKFLM